MVSERRGRILCCDCSSLPTCSLHACLTRADLSLLTRHLPLPPSCLRLFSRPLPPRTAHASPHSCGQDTNPLKNRLKLGSGLGGLTVSGIPSRRRCPRQVWTIARDTPPPVLPQSPCISPFSPIQLGCSLSSSLYHRSPLVPGDCRGTPGYPPGRTTLPVSVACVCVRT